MCTIWEDMERMSNKKRNTIIIEVLLILVLIVLGICGLSCGKSKDKEDTFISTETDVADNQKLDGFKETEMEASTDSESENGQIAGDNLSDEQTDDEQYADGSYTENQSENSSDLQAVKKTTTGSYKKDKRNTVGTGDLDINDGQKSESINMSSNGSFEGADFYGESTSTGYAQAKKKQTPLAEDIDLSGKIATDESGAIVFPFVSYE